jgi:hypothetical protein
MGGSLSGRNNNALGLSSGGYDLLVTGDNGVYDQPHSPVKVDGQEQHFSSAHRRGATEAPCFRRAP